MNRTTNLFAAILPPFVTAIGYAGAKAIGHGSEWPGLYWQSPAMYSFFAGLLIALGLRPVLTRIPWRRGTAFALVLACLAAIGPLSVWCEAALLDSLGWLAFPYALRRGAMPDLLGAWAAAGLLAWFYRPSGGEIGWHRVYSRLQRHPPRRLLTRLAWLGLAVSAVSAAFGLADSALARSGWMQPLDPVNPWLRLAMAGAEGTPNGTGAALEGFARVPAVLFVDWLRGVLFAVPLLGLALVIRASKPQMALVFGLAVFIIGQFAPLMEDQPFPSQTWLSLRVAFAALSSALIGWAAAHLIGPLSPDRSPAP
jgi:hypothetical protein